MHTYRWRRPHAPAPAVYWRRNWYLDSWVSLGRWNLFERPHHMQHAMWWRQA